MITGGAGQIGKAAAKRFLSDGATVVLVDLNIGVLQKAAAELGLDDTHLLLAADVSNEAETKVYVDAAVKKYGHIDVFFNNAGVTGSRQMIHEMDMSHWQKLMDVNLRGILLGLKYVLPVMYAQQSGSVINTASQAGLKAQPGGSDYCVSKAAIIMLTKVAAIESGPHGVRVNAVLPGIIKSEMILQNNAKMGITEEIFAKQLAEMIPLGRWAELDEIAKAVEFLGSDDASYISGVDFKVDGGSLAKS